MLPESDAKSEFVGTIAFSSFFIDIMSEEREVSILPSSL